MRMKDVLLAAAVKVAESIPLHSVTRDAIAKRAKCAPSLVTWYLGSAEGIRLAIVHAAIETKNVEVIAGALSILPRYPEVPKKLLSAAFKSLAE